MLTRTDVLRRLSSRPLRVIAAGKAAHGMTEALIRLLPGRVRGGLIVSTEAPGAALPGFEARAGGHPTPTQESAAAGARALSIAAALDAGERLVVLLSGGASALMAAPVAGVSLSDKRDATARLLKAGADIQALNTVRKHLSRIKGGWLGATAAAPSLTLAISDVIGDDLSAIGSGPTVADPTTYAEALGILDRFGPPAAYPPAIVDWLTRGTRGEVPETPKPGDSRLASASALVIASRVDALEGARTAARALGYEVVVWQDAVIGEAREASREHLIRANALVRKLARPACVLAAGETTVRVRGGGRGGRNQEFALAAAASLDRLGRTVVCGSLGTDGIDGPTDAAGAIVDSTTMERAAAAGLGLPETYLRDNNSYAFLSAVGDLVVTGPTGTNVGDLQILLIAGT